MLLHYGHNNQYVNAMLIVSTKQVQNKTNDSCTIIDACWPDLSCM